MAELIFEDLAFMEKKDLVVVTFLDFFYFEISKDKLLKIASFEVSKHKIAFECSQERAEHKLNQLISNGIEQNLISKITGRRTIYIHRNSGIPLIGTNYFGIVDRGSSLIEIKPVTGCNLNCCYCSVDEGPLSKTRIVDFVVEKDYLLQEIKKVVDFKAINGIEIHIGTQGEPLLYKPLIELILGLREIKHISTISMDTNGVMLSKEKINALISAGLTRFNLSINAITPNIAKRVASAAYDVKKVLKNAAYIAKKAAIILTPVYIPGINDEEMPNIIEFAIKHNAQIGIQNFLCYDHGRNPVNEKKFDEFYAQLKVWEIKYGVKLIHSADDFAIKPSKSLPKPFKKGDMIRAVIACPGRLSREMLAAAKDRVISVPHCHVKIGKEISLRIIRSKHNIFSGIVN
jgi:uncharacterized Fe-S cluster-containing radical SAM superfamily enzyme